jgi:phenylalanyl-tRNA synthetase beta chain
MIISYNWLKSYMTNPEAMPTPEKIADLFTMRAFEVESVEEKDGDTIYDIKLTVDRSPYAYGIRYVALELALLIPELNFDPEFLKEGSLENFAISESLVTESAKPFCPAYTLTRIDNVENTPSPKEVVEKLESLGQQSRGLLVDLTNLVMYDTGQPLHAFDADKIEGSIQVRVLDADAKTNILGGKEVSLKKGTLVIADDAGILAIAGVKGCVKAEVTSETKNIYLESALFDRVTVRKTSRALDIINDSSKRFEQGISPERHVLGVEVYVEKIKQYFPEAIIHKTYSSVEEKIFIDSFSLSTIDVNIDRSINLIDAGDNSLKNAFIHFIENTLPKTGATVGKKGVDTYTVTAPLYRTDLQTEADVVDEFIRNVGYGAVAYRPTKTVTEVHQEKRYKVLHKIRKFLTERMYTEVLLHTLVDSKKNPDAVLLENSLTSERDSLRARLAPELTVAITKNFPFLDLVEKKAVELFEIGNVNYVHEKKEVKQKLHLALGIGMPKWPKKRDESRMPVNMLRELALYLEVDAAYFDKAVQTENADKTVYVAEVDITDLIDQVTLIESDEIGKTYGSHNARIKSFPYKKASIYPSMSRDLAFFATGESTEEVDTDIRAFAGRHVLIEAVTLFDVFTKEDKTSYAYRFVFQSYEKTLTDEDVKVIMDEINAYVDKKGWIIR